MKKFAGQPLVELLQARMRRDNSSLTKLAKRLNVSQSYMSQICRGNKPVGAASDQFLRSCAVYIGIPAALVWLLAGKFRADDFFVAPTTFDRHLENALEGIARSSIAAETAIDVSTLATLPYAAKILIVLLYERAEGLLLLPPRLGAGEVEAMGQTSVPFGVRVNKPF